MKNRYKFLGIAVLILLVSGLGTAQKNVTFSNLDPLPGDTFSVNEEVSHQASIELEANGETHDVFLKENGFNVYSSAHPGGGNIQNYEFNKTYSSTGSYDYVWEVRDTNGTLVDSFFYDINIETDSPSFDPVDPQEGETIVKDNIGYNQEFSWDAEPGSDENFDFRVYTIDPDGNTEQIEEVLNVQPGVDLSILSEGQIDQYGEWDWYIEAEGRTSGESFTSTVNTFQVETPSGSIDLIKPSPTTDESGDFERIDFTSGSDVEKFSYGGFSGSADWPSGKLKDESNVDKSGRCSSKDRSIINEELFLQLQEEQISSSGYNLVCTYKYNNSFELQDDTHTFNASFSSVSNGIGMVFSSNEFLYDETTGLVSAKFVYDQGSGTYDLKYDDGSNTYTVGTDYEKNDRIDWYVGVGSNGFNDESVSIEYIDTDATEITATGVERPAYVDSIPFEANITAESEGSSTAEFYINNKNIKNIPIEGDGSSGIYSFNESYSSTNYDENISAQLVDSSDNLLDSVSSFNVSVVVSPEFNLIDPENNSDVELDDLENREDNTDYLGELTVGEPGKGTIQVKEPNGSFRDVYSREFNREEINSTFNLETTELIEDINLTYDFDEETNLSDHYEWRLKFDGSSSDKNFSSEVNSYQYGANLLSGTEDVLNNVIKRVANLDKFLRNTLGDGGLIFVALMLSLFGAGLSHRYVEIKELTMSVFSGSMLAFTVQGWIPKSIAFLIVSIILLLLAGILTSKVSGD